MVNLAWNILGLAVLASSVGAQVTQRVSLDSRGRQANSSSSDTSISGDGRLVAFMSWATNLADPPTNGEPHIYVRDRLLGTTERVSVSSSGVPANSYSQAPHCSADGRFVTFDSDATNLVPFAVHGYRNVYLRDLRNGTTELVGIDSNGQPAADGSGGSSISGDGRFVAFGSNSWRSDIFVRDRQNQTTERVSLSSGGAQGNDSSTDPSISADGRFVAFASWASNLVVGDTNNVSDIFVRDRYSQGITERVNVDSSGTPGNRRSFAPSLSADGRVVAFLSLSTNLVPDDSNGVMDAFVHDRWTGRTWCVSVDSSGMPGNDSTYEVAISADGRHVVFTSLATNLVAGDTNQAADTFVHDRQLGTTERANLEPSGAQAHYGGGGIRTPSISADGRFVAFPNWANDLVGGDTNNEFDAFVRDRSHAGFASLCEPGRSGVVSCPCSNPPSGPERGCDNSSASGGGSLWLSGGEYLSSDTIVFTATGVIPHGLGIVLQGTSILSAGATYGQGVRCIAGSWKRLYVLIAQEGGRMTGPVILAGQPMVHERSAALGDVIPAGSTRWYMVAYRNAVVLGGCPATSTFNATQAREVHWVP